MRRGSGRRVEHRRLLHPSDRRWRILLESSILLRTWQLRIFPNGRSARDSSGHVGLDLVKCCHSPSVDQSFSLSLKTADGKRHNEVHLTRDFDNKNWLHEIHRFMPRSELLRRKSELLPDCVLTVLCTLKKKSENIGAKTSTQTGKEDAEKSENICVETSTQTGEENAEKSENISVDTSAQTEKEIGEGFESIFVVTSAETRKVDGNDLEQKSENTSVEPCIQLDETSGNSKRIYVNTSTQTGEENVERDWVTDVLDFLRAGNGVDVTFEVETPNGHVEFFAHKLILAMRSPYFADEFYGEGKKSDAHLVIPLKGINPRAFMEMLRYWYDNKPRMRTIEDACVLFKVASDFKLLNLQKLCHAFIKEAEIEP